MNISLPLALCALAALAGSAVQAAPSTNKPAPDDSRFGGDFGFGPPGPYVGYWGEQCRLWHIRTQENLGAPPPSPAVQATLKGFVAGTISGKPNYDDMSPAMAKVVQNRLSFYRTSLLRLGGPASTQSVGADSQGENGYVVDQQGGETHWNIVLNAQGKIEMAFVCKGTGS